jgi:hypothetical protein
MTQSIDGARLTLMLNDLRLPAIKQDWSGFAERADKEGWPAARFLATLAEHEIAERDRRRLARHLAEAQLLPGKTLDSFDFDVVPMISKARVMAICAALPHLKCSPRPTCCLTQNVPQRCGLVGAEDGADQHGDKRRVGGRVSRTLRV